MNRANAFILVAAVIGMTAGSISPASVADAQNKPPNFLFSEDDQIRQTAAQFNSSVQPKTIVHDDQWLNGPLTRLDYVLIHIQSYLTSSQSNISETLMKEYFFDFDPIGAPSADFGASYSDEKGRLFIGVNVGIVGKPKKSMKEFCQRMLGRIELSYPLKPLGSTFFWHNNALGILVRDDAHKYDEVVQKLAKSAVLTVSVSSSYPSSGKNALFMLGCSQDADGPITFYKYSGFLDTR